jgi:biotin carboxyl carrier protein
MFFVVAWLIVLMPFLFWWNTWFGRQLSDAQVDSYLHDRQKPRHIQHALVQIGDRIAKGDKSVAKWYPEMQNLATHPAEEIRNTDAWAMGQDTSVSGFHEALRAMLHDSSPMVRGNAALALVRFGDASGKAEILALLQPARITAMEAGRVTDVAKTGTPIHQHGLVAKLETASGEAEIRTPITGRVRTMKIIPGQQIAAGTEVAIVDPGSEQVWEALRALYVIGTPDDLPAIVPYQHELPDLPERVRQQAVLTEQAIRQRAGQ